MREYFCTGVISFMLEGKSLLHCTNLFSRNKYERIDKMILNSFQKIKTKNFYE